LQAARHHDGNTYTVLYDRGSRPVVAVGRRLNCSGDTSRLRLRRAWGVGRL